MESLSSLILFLLEAYSATREKREHEENFTAQKGRSHPLR
jgi:hypothetical protein